MTPYRIFELDPNAVLDFAFSWKKWLQPDEAIETYTVTAKPGVTVGDVSQTNGVVKVWLSDGQINTKPRVTCHIATNQGRTDDRSLIVQIDER